MMKIARRFRRPTVALIVALGASANHESRKLAMQLWQLRAGMPTRYAATATTSQQKRRKSQRRRCPHGH